MSLAFLNINIVSPVPFPYSALWVELPLCFSVASLLNDHDGLPKQLRTDTFPISFSVLQSRFGDGVLPVPLTTETLPFPVFVAEMVMVSRRRRWCWVRLGDLISTCSLNGPSSSEITIGSVMFTGSCLTAIVARA